MKEQLVEMTTLSPRVIRVWFQNKRCKDKKIQQRMQEKQMQRECVSYLQHYYFYCICSPTSYDNKIKRTLLQNNITLRKILF